MLYPVNSAASLVVIQSVGLKLLVIVLPRPNRALLAWSSSGHSSLAIAAGR